MDEIYLFAKMREQLNQEARYVAFLQSMLRACFSEQCAHGKPEIAIPDTGDLLMFQESIHK